PTAPTATYTLSLHDALPICGTVWVRCANHTAARPESVALNRHFLQYLFKSEQPGTLLAANTAYTAESGTSRATLPRIIATERHYARNHFSSNNKLPLCPIYAPFYAPLAPLYLRPSAHCPCEPPTNCRRASNNPPCCAPIP